MTVVIVIVSVVAGLWIWGALQRWAAQPTPEERLAAIQREEGRRRRNTGS